MLRIQNAFVVLLLVSSLASAQSVCSNACRANSTVLVQSCANAVLPSNGFPCLFLPDRASFEACVAQACPQLGFQLTHQGCDNCLNNPECAYCITDTQPNESNADVIERCSGRPYNSTTAALCKFGDPQNLTVAAGTTASFSTSLNGHPLPDVQWQISTDGGMTFLNAPPPSNSLTYSFTSALPLNGYQYRAVLSDVLITLNTNPATLNVEAPPTLSVSSDTSAIQFPARTATLTFTLANPSLNPQPLTGIGFIDNLPAGLVVASPSVVTGSCGGGTITANAGASVISLSGATLAQGTSCTFSAQVTATQLALFQNSVTANSDNGGASNTATATIDLSDLFFLWFFFT